MYNQWGTFGLIKYENRARFGTTLMPQLRGDEQKFKEYFRMVSDSFNWQLNLIKGVIFKMKTNYSSNYPRRVTCCHIKVVSKTTVIILQLCGNVNCYWYIYTLSKEKLITISCPHKYYVLYNMKNFIFSHNLFTVLNWNLYLYLDLD